MLDDSSYHLGGDFKYALYNFIEKVIYIDDQCNKGPFLSK